MKAVKPGVLSGLFICMGMASSMHAAHAGLFGNSEQESDDFRAAVISTVPDAMYKTLEKKEKSKDAALYLLEKARLLQTHQQYEASKQAYQAAFALIDAKNNKAVVSASGIGYKALSLVSNDSVVPYSIPPYEQVLAHVYQSLNYMALNDGEAAGVEMRVAQRIQREIEIAHEKEAQKARDKAAKNQQPSEEQNVDAALAGLDTIAGKVKNTYQNAYAFYMAATLWEALGEQNDALVDFKKAYELQPDNQIGADVKRLDAPAASTADTFPVVVFIEQGLVPQKQEASMAIPTPGGLVNIAYATYNTATYQQPVMTTVYMDGARIGSTYQLTDIGALAIKTHKENIAEDLTTQIARSTAKYAAQREIGNRLGVFGQLAANVYNTATERADLRAWTTLPGNAQVLRLQLPAGTHDLELVTGYARQKVTVTVKPGNTTFVHGVEANNSMVASSFNISR